MVRFMRNLDKAVTFLVKHVRDPNDDPRQARDKIRKRVLHALAAGDLSADSMLFDTGDGAEPPPRFVAWARTKWPAELQRFTAELIGDGGSVAGFMDAAHGDVLPGEIGRCQDYLQHAYSGIRAMAKEKSLVGPAQRAE